MNCPHERARGKEAACLGCQNLAKRALPKTIAAMRELVARLPDEQPAIWALVAVAIEEATIEAARNEAERIERFCSSLGIIAKSLNPRVANALEPSERK